MKTKNKRSYLKQSGITLIALVVTIVVLLILAAVSLNAIFSENGIIKRAKDAQNKMDEATQNDLNAINGLNEWLDSKTNGTKTEEEEVPEILQRYILGEDKKGIIGTTIFNLNTNKFINNDIIPDAETSMKAVDNNINGNVMELIFEYGGKQYIVTGDATNYMTKTLKLYNSGNIVLSSDAFSATVVLNPAENEAQPTFEQKKEIAAILCDFSSYEELTKEYEDKISQLNMTEEQLVNKIIEVGRMFISYNNAEEVAKLKNLGVKIITVETPYGSTLYTSNLGEPVKCSFNKNGSYDFIIKSDGEEKKETIKIDSIRTSAQTSPYKVKLETLLLTTGLGTESGLLYSTDETNIWKELNEENVVECNKSISIKFSGSKPEETVGYGLHYVEKNNEYYKYFNDQNPMEWGLIRSNYNITYGLKLNPPIRRTIIGTKLLGANDTFEYVLKATLSNLNTSRNIDFLNEFSSWTHGNSLTKEMVQKYPELALGHDHVITWTESDGEESPIYKLEVDHDMSVILHEEEWD